MSERFIKCVRVGKLSLSNCPDVDGIYRTLRPIILFGAILAIQSSFRFHIVSVNETKMADKMKCSFLTYL